MLRELKINFAAGKKCWETGFETKKKFMIFVLIVGVEREWPNCCSWYDSNPTIFHEIHMHDSQKFNV